MTSLRRSRTTTSLVAATAFVLVLGACGGGDTDADDESTPVPSATGASDAPTENATDGATDDIEPTPDAAEDGATDGATAAAGEVVPGFPTEVIGVTPEATVTATSAVPGQDGLTEVSLSGSTPESVATVLAFYADTLASAGLTFSGVTDEGVRLYVRSEGEEQISVAAVPDGDGCTFTVGGVLLLD